MGSNPTGGTAPGSEITRIREEDIASISDVSSGVIELVSRAFALQRRRSTVWLVNLDVRRRNIARGRSSVRVRGGAVAVALAMVVVLSGCSGGAVPAIGAAAVQLDSAVQTASLALQQADADITFTPVAETTLENAITEVDDVSTQLSETPVQTGREQDAKREATAVLQDAVAVLDDARTALQAGDDLPDTVEQLQQTAKQTAELRERWEPFS
ncbi:hypothetical protein EAO79_10745 [Plantibacter sp. PA-3-X8]|uniref:hypothetical protein n=1 Tax=Plantibacter sp. PA-3-X8 TaxID=2480625 RepID=UPI000F60400F|nr:hypothetical protein [Plantibacter sp. PA-3-X8]AZH83324.1 hypothetical protein EAO79_10745 [Plantibacter sp. PA-3-X8]